MAMRNLPIILSKLDIQGGPTGFRFLLLLEREGERERERKREMGGDRSNGPLG